VTDGPEADPIRGRVALITGASSGIGAAGAVALAREGARVGICARRSDRLEAVAAECRALGADVSSWTIDLEDLDALRGFARQVEADLGPIEVLVNNAGAPLRRKMQDITPAEIDGIMRLNFMSPVVLTTAVLPGMLDRGWGRIVNVSSMGTRTAAVRVGAYAASKAALDSWTEGLLLDLLGTGVRAQLLVPGTTKSEFARSRGPGDEPFPPDPNALDAEVVADALVRLLRSDDFEGFASDAHAALSAQKRSDPNAFLAMVSELLGSEQPSGP
jgi:short-subunit dehydrogenase